MGEMWFVGFLIVAGGVTLLITAWHGRAGRLPPNGLVGIRTPSAMQSERAWYEMHRRAAPLLAVEGAIFVVAGGCVLAVPTLLAARIASVVAGVLTVVMVVGTWRIDRSLEP